MSSSRKRSHHHNDDDSDDNEIKIIPFKKQCEEVKTIKIVRDGSPVPVSQRVVCNICNESLMSQAYLDRHMKALHSANSLVCNDCGVVKKETRKKLRDHKRIHVQCVCKKQSVENRFQRWVLDSIWTSSAKEIKLKLLLFIKTKSIKVSFAPILVFPYFEN